MWEDPIVKEVHQTRARILDRFGGDFDAYLRYLQALEAEEKERGIPYVSLSSRQRKGKTPDAA
jgi:hypothetical protein